MIASSTVRGFGLSGCGGDCDVFPGETSPAACHYRSGRFSGLFARRAMLGQPIYGWFMSDSSTLVGRTPFQQAYLSSPAICFLYRSRNAKTPLKRGLG